MTQSNVSHSVPTRAEELFLNHQQEVYQRTDRLFAGLLAFQWAAGITIAWWISPLAWVGAQSQTHLHLWAALLLGGGIVSLPIALTLLRPGLIVTRHVIAIAQMLMGALLIHLTGGRIEMHFHVFGSLAFLAFYRDWRVLVTASVVVAVDHFVRGTFWTQSVFGVLTANPWRWLEHAGWVAFEDMFLIHACLQGVKEMLAIATRQAEVEAINANIEQEIAERTAQLQQAEGEMAAVIRAVPDVFYRIDLAGNVQWWNPNVEAVTGLTVDQIKDRHALEFFVAEDRPKVALAIQTILTTGFVRVDASFMTTTGPTPYEFVGVQLKGQDGMPCGIIGIGRDISERRKAQSILLAAKEAAEVALARVKQLQGLLPICSYCMKIRADKNYWQKVEYYIADHSEARFSHGICPECMDTVVKKELAELHEVLDGERSLEKTTVKPLRKCMEG